VRPEQWRERAAVGVGQRDDLIEQVAREFEDYG